MKDCVYALCSRIPRNELYINATLIVLSCTWILLLMNASTMWSLFKGCLCFANSDSQFSTIERGLNENLKTLFLNIRLHNYLPFIGEWIETCNSNMNITSEFNAKFVSTALERCSWSCSGLKVNTHLPSKPNLEIAFSFWNCSMRSQSAAAVLNSPVNSSPPSQPVPQSTRSWRGLDHHLTFCCQNLNK